MLRLFWFVFTSPDMRARARLTWWWLIRGAPHHVAALLVAATCNRAGDGLDVAEVCGAITRMHQRNAREQEPDRGEIVSTPAVWPEKLSDANA